MSTLAPFNFYQGTGWGPYDPTDSFYPNPAPPFPSNDLDFWTGVFLDPAIEAGKGVGFTWNTPDTPSFHEMNISGSLIDANTHIANLHFGWRGSFYPLHKDTGSVLSSSWTGGNVASGLADFPVLKASMHSFITGDNIDSGINKMQWTGASIQSGLWDSGVMKLAMTGSLQSGQAIRMDFQVNIYGVFTSPYRDIFESVGFSFTGIDYEDQGAQFKTYGRADTGNLKFHFARIAYSNY